MMYKFKYPLDKNTNELWQELDIVKYLNNEYSKNYIRFVESRFIDFPMIVVPYSIQYKKQRWVEAEYIISKSFLYRKDYINHFFKDGFPNDEIETNPLYKHWYDILMEKICPSHKKPFSYKDIINDLGKFIDEKSGPSEFISNNLMIERLDTIRKESYLHSQTKISPMFIDYPDIINPCKEIEFENKWSVNYRTGGMKTLNKERYSYGLQVS